MSGGGIESGARRYVKSRDTRWAFRCSMKLREFGIKPNTISIFSIVFSAIASALIFFVPYLNSNILSSIFYVAALNGIVLRLLCNLFDGMVAVEGGFSSPVGELYNDIPDRISDCLIFVAAGYSVSHKYKYGVELGWLAGVMAVIVAYVRLLGASCGAGNLFLGPMAKQHRMAIINIACILSSIAVFWGFDGVIMLAALCIIIIGCVITFVRRISTVSGVLWDKSK